MIIFKAWDLFLFKIIYSGYNKIVEVLQYDFRKNGQNKKGFLVENRNELMDIISNKVNNNHNILSDKFATAAFNYFMKQMPGALYYKDKDGKYFRILTKDVYPAIHYFLICGLGNNFC